MFWISLSVSYDDCLQLIIWSSSKVWVGFCKTCWSALKPLGPSSLCFRMKLVTLCSDFIFENRISRLWSERPQLSKRNRFMHCGYIANVFDSAAIWPSDNLYVIRASCLFTTCCSNGSASSPARWQTLKNAKLGFVLYLTTEIGIVSFLCTVLYSTL